MGNTQIKKEKEELTKNLETLAVITNAISLTYEEKEKEIKKVLEKIY